MVHRTALPTRFAGIKEVKRTTLKKISVISVRKNISALLALIWDLSPLINLEPAFMPVHGCLCGLCVRVCARECVSVCVCVFTVFKCMTDVPTN